MGDAEARAIAEAWDRFHAEILGETLHQDTAEQNEPPSEPVKQG
ncbi:hypothetical protein [Vibrio fluvialis]|jgi:hypothetical protein|nr:hypothetical protein [Vibrio fluvialis]